MSKDNPISTAVEKFRKATVTPLGAALLAGLGAGAVSSVFRRPFVSTVRSLGRVFSNKPEVEKSDLDETLDDIENGEASENFPVLAGTTAALATLGSMYRPNEAYGGVFNWKSPFVKRGALESGYLTDIDFGKRISAPAAMALFSNDPNLQDSPYVRNFGTSIVSAAALGQHTSRPTLGGVFDSAVDKFNSKLTLGGITRTAVRATVANAAARMFTGALGTMMDLPEGMRDNLVSAGTWAGAISSILD